MTGPGRAPERRDKESVASWLEDARRARRTGDHAPWTVWITMVLTSCGRDDDASAELALARHEARTDPSALALLALGSSWTSLVRHENTWAEAALPQLAPPVSPLSRSLHFLISTSLARRGGRPLTAPDHAPDTSAFPLAHAIASRLELEYAACDRLHAHAHLRAAVALAAAAHSPDVMLLARCEAALFDAVDANTTATLRVARDAVSALGHAGLARDAGRAMLRFAEIVAAHPNAEGESAARWLGQAQATLGAGATAHDRIALHAAFRAYGRRAVDRAMTDSAAAHLDAFERARGTLLGAMTAAMDMTDQVESSLVARVRVARTQGITELDSATRELFGLVGAALVDHERMRGVLDMLQAVDSMRDEAALLALVVERSARLLDADHTVIAWIHGHGPVCASRFGSAPDGAETLWEHAVASAPGVTALHDLALRPRADHESMGAVIVAPLSVGPTR
ncbi:MAG: hypothetical protein WCI05_13200, partial [Myxococcales bacterium]